MIASSQAWLRDNRWAWSFIGALLVWIITSITAEGRGMGATLSAALAFSSFYVMAGIGEMLVVSLGAGNIDLSIPSVMTLAGYLSIGTMQGQAGSLWLGVAIALGVGALAGLANFLLIRFARIPPMVATLAASNSTINQTTRIFRSRRSAGESVAKAAQASGRSRRSDRASSTRSGAKAARPVLSPSTSCTYWPGPPR